MPVLRLRALPLLAALTLHGAVVHAEAFDDRVYLTPMGSYVLADDARRSDDGKGGALALGRRFSPRLELELRGSYLEYDRDPPPRTPAEQLACQAGGCPDPDTLELKHYGAGGNWFFSPTGRGLYVHADLMGGDSTLWNAGLGLHLGGESGFGLRLEALYHDDDGDFRETLFNVGLHVPLGARRQAAVIEEHARVVPPVAPAPAPPPPPPPACEMPPAGQALSLDGCKPGDTLVLHGVNFEFDQARLTVNAQTLLDLVATALLARSDITVEIRGHTDSRGADAYNQRLSERRARAVLDYLIGKGVGAERLAARGFGESQPVADNDSDEGRERNRRVELAVIAAGGAVTPPAEAPCPAPAPGEAVDERGCAVPAPVDGAGPATLEAAPAAAPAEAVPDDGGAHSHAPAASASAAEPPTATSGEAQVRIGEMVFEPANLTVARGSTVTWTNADGSNHNVKFADQESGRLKMGATYSRRFDAPGEYPYHCKIHGQTMAGTIIVQ